MSPPLQPPPFAAPYFAAPGILSEEWRRFFLGTQAVITILLATVASGASMAAAVGLDLGESRGDEYLIPPPVLWMPTLLVANGNRIVRINSDLTGSGGLLQLSRADDAKFTLALGTGSTPNDDSVIYSDGGGAELRFFSAGGTGGGFGFYADIDEVNIPIATAFASARPTGNLVVKIDREGHVGVLTATPLAPVHVHVGTNQNLYLRGESSPFCQVTAINDANTLYVPLRIDANHLLLNYASGANVGIGIQTTPLSRLHLAAGTATANTAPFQFSSGTLETTARAGVLEFLTDDFFATITTGAARKAFVLDDGARLTVGRVPVATTNGRLIDGPGLATINTTGLTANVAASTLYAVPSTGAGLYRVSAFVVETTAGSVTSTLPNVQVVYTDNDTGGSVTLDATPILGVAGIGQTGALTANTVGTTATGVVVVNVQASTTIQYQTVNYASNLAGMAYALHLRLEAL